MRTVSAAWAPLVATYREGRGVEDYLAVLVPSRNLALTSRLWPEGWLPAGITVYPSLAARGQGIGSISVELADDRSSRLGTVNCQVRIQAGQAGAPLSSLQQLLLTLAEQPAVVCAGFLGGLAHADAEILTLFSGRIATPRLARGLLTFTIVDGSKYDHRDIEVPLGSSVFPGAPLEAHGLSIPLVIGTALGVAPTLVSSLANGTLATPLPAADVETINLEETGANFPEAGAVLIDSETITYSGRRIGLLLDGASALQLLNPVRSAPVEHLAGAAVTLAPPLVYRYLIGLGLTPLELLAVRDQDGVIAEYTFVPSAPGLPADTAVLELPSAHEGVQVDVQVIPEPPLPPLLNGGFEAGTLAPWTALAGSTAAVVLQETQAGTYKLQLQEVGTALAGVTQDVAVQVGERYVLLFHWRTPIRMADNLLDNGDFGEPPDVFWEIIIAGAEYPEPTYDPPPVPVAPPEPPPEPPPPSVVDEHGRLVFTLPPAPFYELPDPLEPAGFLTAAGYATYHIAMRQTLNAALTPGQAIMIDVRAAAFIQRAVPGLVPPTVTISEPSGVAGNFGVPTLPGHLPPLSEVTINARLWPLNPNASFPAWQRFLQPDQPPSTEGRLVEFRLPLGQDRMVPTQTNYQFEVVVSGVYIGTIPPIVVSTAVVSVA